MRILLRHWNDKDYVWKEASYKDSQYYIEEDGNEYMIYETDIAAVEGHTMVGYVACIACGELIKDTPEDIEAHYRKRETERDCTKCNKLRFERNEDNVKRELVENEYGSYDVTEKFTSRLFCGNTYSRIPCDSHRVAQVCKFYNCRRQGVTRMNDIFAAYPGVFDTVITADVLAEKKLRFDGYSNDYFKYDMKSRNTIKACVNKSGIVECFWASSNGSGCYFYYSEKYDKLFYRNGAHYLDGKPYWFRDAKFEELHKRVKALYEGVKEND